MTQERVFISPGLWSDHLLGLYDPNPNLKPNPSSGSGGDGV